MTSNAGKEQMWHTKCKGQRQLPVEGGECAGLEDVCALEPWGTQEGVSTGQGNICNNEGTKLHVLGESLIIMCAVSDKK